MSNVIPALGTMPESKAIARFERPALVEGSLGFQETLHKFLGYSRVRNYSERTLEKYGKDLAHLFAFLEKRGIDRLDDVTKRDLIEYENEVYASVRIKDGSPLAQSSKVGRMVALKSFYNFLSKTELIPYNPAATIDLPVVRNKKLREILTEEEAFKLLESAKGVNPIDIRNRAILELLYSTGIRAEELINVGIRDLDLDKEELRIRYGKGRLGKSERLVPVGRVAIEWLKIYATNVRPIFQKSDDEGLLFVTINGRKLLINDPNRIVKMHARKAGITRRIVCHSMRHSCATHMLKRGCDIRFIQELLGHESIETTVVYTRLVIDDLKEIHDKTHPREQKEKES